MVEWKFTELDANSDRVLDSRELERLARLVKKLVKPTSCAVSFKSRCDLSFDSSLTLHEWNSCFDDDDDDDDDDSNAHSAGDVDNFKQFFKTILFSSYTSVTNALEVINVMRSINPRFTYFYLLTMVVALQRGGCVREQGGYEHGRHLCGWSSMHFAGIRKFDYFFGVSYL